MVGQKLEGCWKQLTELKGEDIEAAAFLSSSVRSEMKVIIKHRCINNLPVN